MNDQNFGGVICDDIFENILAINKFTIDNLFNFDDGGASLTLYIFYLKTAKWQNTNKIKANDIYVMKCLSWGKSKVTETKKKLKEKGFIEVMQQRENGKIGAWYIKVNYIYNHNHPKQEVDSKKYCEQEVLRARSCSQDTNALYNNINALNNNLNIKKINKKDFENEKWFDEFWGLYPKKSSKDKTKKKFLSVCKNQEVFETIMNGLRNYIRIIEVRKISNEYIKHPHGWLNDERYKDEYNFNELQGITIKHKQEKQTDYFSELAKQHGVDFSELFGGNEYE